MSKQVPLRVDLGGGWLDVPKHAIPGAFIVNCAITPLVSLDNWPYEKGSGLGGSAAWALLNGRDPFASEDALGVGWQDPAVIQETGLCVWRSGPKPVLHCKVNPDFLSGKMALKWLGSSHDTPGLVDKPRDYDQIVYAGDQAAGGVASRWYPNILCGVRWSYVAQRGEGMPELPVIDNAMSQKYCGGGWGGYALYLFATRKNRDASGLIPIEPYMREFTE